MFGFENEFLDFSEYLWIFSEFSYNCEILIFGILSWNKYSKFVNFDSSEKKEIVEKIHVDKKYLRIQFKRGKKNSDHI